MFLPRPPHPLQHARGSRAPGRERPRSRAQAGQASLEYVAIVAVAAVVLVLAGAVTGTGGVVDAVGRGLERALCVVGGGDCYATEIQACTLRSSQTDGHLGVKVTFVALGGHISLLRQELSDGTVDITLLDGTEVAPTAAVGAEGGVRTGAGGVGGGAISSAELLVRLGRRRVWHVAGDAAADRLVRDVERDVALRLATHASPVIGRPLSVLAHLAGVDGPRLPPADVIGLSAGVKGVVAARLPGGSSFAAGLESSLGGSRDRATGRTTFVLGLQAEAAGELGAAVGGVGLSASGGASVAVTFDRSGAPLDLAVSIAGTPRPGLSAGLELPGERRASGVDAQRVELTTHLDLTRPDDRAAYDALVRGLVRTSRGSLAPALLGLARRLRQAGRQELARYATRSATYGAGGQVALVARAGADAELTRTVRVLQDAWSRPAGGVWAQRTDCLRGGTRA